MQKKGGMSGRGRGRSMLSSRTNGSGMRGCAIKKNKKKYKKTQSTCFAVAAAPKLDTALLCLYVSVCVCVRDSSWKLASSCRASHPTPPSQFIHNSNGQEQDRPKAKAIRAQISNKSAQNQQQQ